MAAGAETISVPPGIEGCRPVRPQAKRLMPSGGMLRVAA